MKDTMIIALGTAAFVAALGIVADAPTENIAKAAALWAALTAAPGILAELWFRWNKD